VQILEKKLPTIAGLPSNITAISLAQEVQKIEFLKVDLSVHLSYCFITSIRQEPVRTLVRHEFTRSISAIWLVCTPILGLGLFLVLFMRKYSLKRTIIREKEGDQKSSEVEAGRTGG
jgi:hypothetical protein